MEKDLLTDFDIDMILEKFEKSCFAI